MTALPQLIGQDSWQTEYQYIISITLVIMSQRWLWLMVHVTNGLVPKTWILRCACKKIKVTSKENERKGNTLQWSTEMSTHLKILAQNWTELWGMWVENLSVSGFHTTSIWCCLTVLLWEARNTAAGPDLNVMALVITRTSTQCLSDWVSPYTYVVPSFTKYSVRFRNHFRHY